MKFIVVLALCFCGIQITLAELRMKGERFGIFGRGVKLPAAICTANNIDKRYCNGDTSCESTGVVQCSGTATGITAPCPMEKPYCIASSAGTADCETDPADGCTVNTPSFVCTSPGVFPEPTSCKIFYKCNLNPATSVITPVAYYCSAANYVFDPNAVSDDYCLYTTVASKCIVATTACSSATTASVALKYVNNAQYAAVCTDPVQIIQCATGAKLNLSDFLPSCIYTCPGEALYPYSLDPAYYYDCKYDASLRLVATLRKCQAPYTKFDKTKCV